MQKSRFDLKSLMLKELSDDALSKIQKDRISKAMENPMAFENWYSKIKDLGVSTPESVIIDLPYDLQGCIIDSVDTPEVKQSLLVICDQIKAAGEKFGYPLFMKNSLFSAKHDWESTCFISDSDTLEDILGKVVNLTYLWAMVGADISLKLIVRKFIETSPLFYAFDGKMPITREFRFFSEDGVTSGYQFYWPHSAIQSPSDDSWSAVLKEASYISSDDVRELSKISSAISKKLGGAWSVDFLIDKNGKWHVIDLALAVLSYVSDDFVDLS